MSGTEPDPGEVYIELARDGGGTGGFQLSINVATGPGGVGHGYRLFGPKYRGSSSVIKHLPLTARDRDEIRAYLDLIPDDEEGVTDA